MLLRRHSGSKIVVLCLMVLGRIVMGLLEPDRTVAILLRRHRDRWIIVLGLMVLGLLKPKRTVDILYWRPGHRIGKIATIQRLNL